MIESSIGGTATVQMSVGDFKKILRQNGFIATCVMTGCMNRVSKGFVTCVACRQRRLLAQIAELIPEDVEA
jgi:hypothetical protein